jgi:anti-sigma-K factor RskA
MPEVHVIDDLPALALNILDESEKMRVTQHISACADCQLEWQAYRDTVGALGEVSKRKDPPPALRQAILRQAEASIAAQAPARAAAPSPRPTWMDTLRRLITPSPALGMAGLALILVLAAGNILLLRQVDNLSSMQRHGYQSVLLTGTSKAPAARGMVVYTVDGKSGFLVVNSMQTLPQEKQYQLWLIKDNKRTSGGVFSVEADGYHVIEINSPIPLTSYDAFGITIEPAGGSPGPTGDKVLGGKF